jgi:hypothetical protein
MTSRARSRRLAASWTAAAVCALALAGCSKGAVTGSAGTEVDAAAKPKATVDQKRTEAPVEAKPLAKPTGAHINIADGQTVGVGLATDGTAKKFYDEVIPGDVVTIVGSKDTVAVGNGYGYGDWNADWARWRAGSALR